MSASLLSSSPPSLTHAPLPGHLESCDFCLEQEALSFAELLEYRRADVPAIGYFTDFYRSDRISPEREQAIRARIVALCSAPLQHHPPLPPSKTCRGCNRPIGSRSISAGPYCPPCAKEIRSLICTEHFIAGPMRLPKAILTALIVVVASAAAAATLWWLLR